MQVVQWWAETLFRIVGHALELTTTGTAPPSAVVARAAALRTTLDALLGNADLQPKHRPTAAHALLMLVAVVCHGC